MSLKPCKFTPEGTTKELSYDEFRAYLLENYDSLVPPTKGIEAKAEGEGKEGKKAVLSRLAEGTPPERVREVVEALGLSYEVESHKDAENAAEKFIQKVGVLAAIDAVRNNEISGGPAAYVWVKAVDEIQAMLEKPDLTAEERDALSGLQKQLLNELDIKARTGGRFLSALGDAYTKSDLGYKLPNMIARYEAVTGEKVSDEMKAKFEEYDKNLREISDKLKEAEEKLREAEERIAVENIAEDISRDSKKKAPSTKEIGQKLASKIRQAKINKPGLFNASVPGAVIWDGAVEIVATAVEAGTSFAEALKKGVQHIKDSDFYKSLSDTDKKEAEKQFKEAMNNSRPKIKVTDGKVKVPVSLIREFVANGATNMNDLAQLVLDEIKDENPDITLRDVKDAITGYGKTINPTKDDLQAQINTMKRIGRLESKLEDLRNKIAKEKRPKEKKKLSQEEKELTELIRDEYQSLPEYEKGRTEAAKERIRNKIAELQERIKNQDFSKKKNTPVTEDAEMTKLLAERQKWQDAYNKDLYTAEIKSRSLGQKIADAAIEIWGLPRALMATGELSFMLIQGGIQTIAHPINAARALLKSIQYGWSESKAQKWGEFVKAQPWYSEMKKSKLSLSEYDARLEAREEQFLGGWLNNIWDFAGIPFKVFDKIKIKDLPIINKGRVKINIKGGTPYEMWKQANPVKAIERAGVGYMNTIRVLRYLDGKKLLEMQGKTLDKNTEDYKAMADAINVMTGRSTLGPAEQSQKLKRTLPLIFFSPRNWASQLKLTTPLFLYQLYKMRSKNEGWKPTVAQKMYVGDFMKAVGATAGIVLLFAARYNDDDDEPEMFVETDPRSSDFMTIRIGNTRIDPWGGKKQMIVLQTRLIMDALGKEGYKSATTGNVSYLGEKLTPTSLEVGLRAVQNKLAPSASLLVRYAQTKIDPKTGVRKMQFGDDYDIGTELAGSLYPMYIGTINELWKEQPETVASFLTAAAFFGIGVSTYGGVDESKIQREYDKIYKEFTEKTGLEASEKQNKELIKMAYDNAVKEDEKNRRQMKMNEEERLYDDINQEYKQYFGKNIPKDLEKDVKANIKKKINSEVLKTTEQKEENRRKFVKDYISKMVK